MRCKCNAPAERLTVKKEGVTKGRHFFKCHARVCDFFQWDPIEVQALQEAMTAKGQKRDPEVSPEICRLKEEFEQEKKKLEEERNNLIQVQQVKEQEAQNTLMQMQQLKDQETQAKIEMMMGQANQRHQELLDETAKRNEVLLEESNAKHQELMDVNSMAYRTHLEQLQHQVCWLTTLVGPEKIQEVMTDPQKYAEASAQAQQLRQECGAAGSGLP